MYVVLELPVWEWKGYVRALDLYRGRFTKKNIELIIKLMEKNVLDALPGEIKFADPELVWAVSTSGWFRQDTIRELISIPDIYFIEDYEVAMFSGPSEKVGEHVVRALQVVRKIEHHRPYLYLALFPVAAQTAEEAIQVKKEFLEGKQVPYLARAKFFFEPKRLPA